MDVVADARQVSRITSMAISRSTRAGEGVAARKMTRDQVRPLMNVDCERVRRDHVADLGCWWVAEPLEVPQSWSIWAWPRLTSPGRADGQML